MGGTPAGSSPPSSATTPSTTRGTSPGTTSSAALWGSACKSALPISTAMASSTLLWRVRMGHNCCCSSNVRSLLHGRKFVTRAPRALEQLHHELPGANPRSNEADADRAIRPRPAFAAEHPARDEQGRSSQGDPHGGRVAKELATRGGWLAHQGG